MLAICAAIQVLGHWYETSSGERVDGVGMLDVTTSPQDKRTIGEVVSQPLLTELSDRLTGFENHRGGTVLGSSARPLAKVISGAGNRLGDGIDGAVQGSVVATYLHGPCLARNPELADHLLSPRRRRLGAVGDRRGRAAAQGASGGPPPRLTSTLCSESASKPLQFVDFDEAASAHQGSLDARDHVLRLVLGDHADDDPAERLEHA